MLWERQTELEALGDALDGAERGSGRVVLVSGPAGIGKTSLVRAFLGVASGRARVLLGVCEDLVAPRALGALRDAAAGGAGPLATALATGVRDEVLPAVLAELTAPGPPTVLVIEDLHWADDATLDVVRYLGRRIADVPAVMVLTHRDEPTARAHLVGVLGGLTTPSVRRLELGPLSRAAVARWAGGTNVTTAALYTLTGGNPFFLSEVLAAPGQDVPASVVDAVLARTVTLDADERRTLEQIAVVPTRVELPLARALVGDLGVLAEAERRGLVDVVPEAVSFRHELARRAVAEAIPRARRIELHARVLEALTRTDDPDAARLVHHAVAAGDDATVAVHAVEAARGAARAGAHTQAVELYRQAWHRRDRLDDDALVGEEYSWSLFHARRYADAVRVGEDAVRAREHGGDVADLGRATATISVHQWANLQPEDALASARRAVALLEDTGDTVQRVFALGYLGSMLTAVDLAGEALTALDAAVAMSERLGRVEGRPVALVFRGRARLMHGDVTGLDEVREGLALARELGDHEGVMLGHLNVVGALWQAGRLDEMTVALDESDAYAGLHDFPSYDRMGEALRCRLLIARGDWDAADRGLRRLYEPGRDGGGLLDWFVVPYLAGLAVRRGDGDATALLARSRELAALAPSAATTAAVLVAELEHAWSTGTPGPRDEGERLLRDDPPGGLDRDLGELARWLRRLGSPPEAVEVGSWPAAVTAGLRGDWRAAATAFERLGAPYDRALELAESGERDATLEALRLLQELGAAPAAARVRRRLQELGVHSTPRGPQGATRGNPAGLTRRQLDILRLVGRGHTNAEIADELVLSVRTVDHHVSAVLGKLGVATRREAAREARRLEIA